MSPKEIVKKFYELDVAKDNNVMDFIHEDIEVQWHSSQGFTKLNYNNLSDMVVAIKKSFLSFGYRLSHLLEEEDMVTARFSIYVTPIERPEKEDLLAHFISIWKIKDGKLIEGYEISQLADASAESLKSFSKIID